MSKINKQTSKASCLSEYDRLRQVVLCQPTYMKISEVINETQKHFINENIDIKLAMKQHDTLILTLEEHSIEVILLPPDESFPEQVFTRDIGFTLGRTVFVAKMGRKIRQGEETVLKTWLEQQHIAFYDLTKENIEGGDVLIDQHTIWVGISDRTTEKASAKLQSLIPDYNVMSVPFKKKYLHLDCVFNVLSPDVALIFPPAFRKQELDLLAARYTLIEVTESEQFTLGTNILSIGNKRVISLPVNKKVNEQLQKQGYHVIEVDISEIIKSGGSFRCITLPIVRDERRESQ